MHASIEIVDSTGLTAFAALFSAPACRVQSAPTHTLSLEREMKIVIGILRVCLIGILLYSVLMILRHPSEAHYGSTGTYPFSRGNAAEDVRAEIIGQLHAFQSGYTQRDTSRLDPFMEQLFSRDNVLVLGTMPREVLTSHERTKGLVSSDWRTWGDCRFLMDDAHISASGNVAWISTIGYVKSDLSRFLILPLRLSAVMVKETDTWKFQQMQFQFDVDFSFILLTVVVLLIWLPMSLISLAVVTVRSVRRRRVTAR
jgi:hypothetical protein